jgi:hypothetical protein
LQNRIVALQIAVRGIPKHLVFFEVIKVHNRLRLSVAGKRGRDTFQSVDLPGEMKRVGRRIHALRHTESLPLQKPQS